METTIRSLFRAEVDTGNSSRDININENSCREKYGILLICFVIYIVCINESMYT